MVTTIQLNEDVKKSLDKLKNNKETYEEIIIRLMEIAKNQKKEQEELMIEGAKETAEESLKICEEFKYVDSENLPEWEW